jgi:mRNA interferase MazF
MKQYEVFLIALDPTIGHEIKKNRPCVIISPNEMNDHIGTVIIAPMTTKSHDYPSRISIKFMKKNGWIMIDQIRCIDKSRLIKKIGIIDNVEILKIKNTIKEMLVD